MPDEWVKVEPNCDATREDICLFGNYPKQQLESTSVADIAIADLAIANIGLTSDDVTTYCPEIPNV